MTTRQRRRRSPATAAEGGLDLGALFGAALQNVDANRQQINALDGVNGNHGDNMVHNLQVITQAMQAQHKQAPAEQLRHAAAELQSNGKGGTSQYYAQGLNDAAQRFQGKASVNQNDIGALLQSVMGSVPAKPAGTPRPQAQAPAAGGADSSLASLLGALGGGGAPQPAQAPQGGDPLASLLGAALGGGAPQSAQAPQGGDPLASLLGAALGGGAPQPAQAPQGNANVLTALLGMSQAQPAPQAQTGAGGLDLGDLITAGMAFMQAKQQGADNMQAGMQAVMAALAGNQINPLQSGSPQAAAGGLIAQSLLQAALGRK